MKKFISFLSIFRLFFLCTAANLYAQEVQQEQLQGQLKNIYALYKKNPSESCHQLENALQSPEVASLTPQESKAAYYFLANCNYEQKNPDKAASYYLKIAELDPQDPQPLVDAGNLYVEQGSYTEAEKEYKEALRRVSGNKPQEEKIKTLIENIPGKLQKSYKISTGFGSDSNVNFGPEDQTHLLYGTLNYPLAPDDKPQEDVYFYNSAGAALSKALDPETVLLFNGGVKNTSYVSENEFSSTLLLASMGYKKIFGSKSVTLSPFVNYQTLDNSSYLISSGLNLTGAIRVNEKINLWPHVGWYSQGFYNDQLRDAFGISTGTSASYELDSKTSLVGSLFYTYNDAKNNQYTYNSVFLGSSINRALLESLKAGLGYNLKLSDYDNIDPAFGSAREDTSHTFYVNFDYSLKKLLHMDHTTLSLNVSYNENNSNQSFHDNNRLFSSLRLTFSF